MFSLLFTVIKPSYMKHGLDIVDCFFVCFVFYFLLHVTKHDAIPAEIKSYTVKFSKVSSPHDFLFEYSSLMAFSTYSLQK